jgi:protein Mpv17
MAGVRGLFVSYEKLLFKRPLVTKVPPPPAARIHIVRLLHGRRVCRFAPQAVTSAIIGGIGDLTCQLAIENREKCDVKRLAIFTFMNAAFIAPVIHTWFARLHRLVPGEGAAVVAKRLLADQLAFAPLFVPSFLGCLLTLEGHPHPLRKVAHVYWPTMQANWLLWVPAQAVNFALVPLHFQVLFGNSVGFVWSVYLSWRSHNQGRAPQGIEPTIEPGVVPGSADRDLGRFT